MKLRKRNVNKALALVAIGLTTALASGCGGGGSSTSSAAPTTTEPSAGSGPVLPVPKNPISNSSTAPGLTIRKVLVENNVSPDTGKAVADHLEITLENTSAKPLDQIAIYYTITDKVKGASEAYYAELDGFTIEPGATRVVHFDDTGAKDHYPVNKYSLYYTSKNPLVVEVTASSPPVKLAMFKVKKDAAGAEAGGE